MKTLALATITWFALSSSALAQVEDDEPIPTGDPAGDEVEMGPDDVPAVPFDAEGTPSGAEEDPDAPQLGKVLGEHETVEPVEPPARELLYRPLTLRGRTFQVGYRAGFGGFSEKIAYSYPGNDELVRLGGVLSVAYGITDEVEVRLHYGTGTLGTLGDADASYEVGKTVAVEALYQITDWVAAQVEIPINVEPLAAALTVGAPMKFRVTDELGLFLLEDFLTFKLDEFVPIIEDSVSNEAAVVALDSGTIVPDGDLTIKAGVIYQQSLATAFKGTFGFIAPDFSSDEDPGVMLVGELFHALSDDIDLFGTAGLYNLADTSVSLHVGGGLQLRI